MPVQLSCTLLPDLNSFPPDQGHAFPLLNPAQILFSRQVCLYHVLFRQWPRLKTRPLPYGAGWVPVVLDVALARIVE